MQSPFLNGLDPQGRKCQQGWGTGSLFLHEPFFLVSSLGVRRVLPLILIIYLLASYITSSDHGEGLWNVTDLYKTCLCNAFLSAAVHKNVAVATP